MVRPPAARTLDSGDPAAERESWAGQPLFAIKLANPARFFRFLVAVFMPIRFLRHLIIPLALVAGYAALFNWYPMIANLDRIDAELQFWQTLLIGMVLTTVIAKFAEGMVMGYYGADVTEFGFRLAYGFRPRFYIIREPIVALPFRQQRSCYAAPLLTRLIFFSVGTLGWVILRRSGSGAAEVLLTFGGVGFASFVFAVNPLWPADGYRWLAAHLERPKLREHAMLILGHVLTFKRLPADLKWAEFWALLTYAIGSLLFTSFLVYTVISTMAYMLEAELHGTGVAILCLLAAGLVMYVVAYQGRKKNIWARRRAKKQKREAEALKAAGKPHRSDDGRV